MKTKLRNYKMKPQCRNLEILDHAAKIGYKNKVDRPHLTEEDYLIFYDDGNIFFSIKDEGYYERHKHPEITPDDFLKLGTRFKTEQEFIEKFGTEWKRVVSWNIEGNMDYLFGQDYETADLTRNYTRNYQDYKWRINHDMLTTDSLPDEDKAEPKKEDAYLDRSDWSGKWFVWQLKRERYDFCDELYNAHLYNIISKEDYQRAHPLPEKKLMFKDWEVDVSETRVKIGCEPFTKEDINGFQRIIDVCANHSVLPYELHEFFNIYKQELRL